MIRGSEPTNGKDGGSEDADIRAVHVASQRPPVSASKSTGPIGL
jgi:hypothetical protein